MTSPARETNSHLFAADPPWLDARRRGALARRDLYSAPSGREEAWRYTDVSLLTDSRFFTLGPPVVGGPEVPLRAGQALSSLVQGAAGASLMVDGVHVETQLDPASVPRELLILPLGQAARERPDLVEPFLGSLVGPEDIFTAHSLALHRGGLLVHVPEGVTMERPLRLLHWVSAVGAAVDTRVVVVLGSGASLILEEHFQSDDLPAPTRVQPVSESFVGSGARLTHAQWQSWGRGVLHMGHLRARVEEGGRVTTFLAGLGADFARSHHGVVLAGPGAEADLLGAYFPGPGQHHEHWTTQEHAAERTRSDLLYKGALGGDGRSVYYGTIRVAKGARRANAYQANRNLLLDPRAHADTNPQLEIEHNDVRCTHGATVGQVDQGQLFYLMSRGISRFEAERLLVAGFFAEVVGRLGLAWAEERLAAVVSNRLGSLGLASAPEAPRASHREVS